MKRATFPGGVSGPFLSATGTLLLLVLVAFSLQGCLGIGGSKGKQVATGSNGQTVSVNQDVFKGKFYLTINHNLYALSGNNSSQELVNSGNVSDPAVSPDGKWIVFIEKYKQYSDLCVVSTSGGKVRILRTGNGKFYYIGPYLHNTFTWYAQPSWSADGSTLLFLSDLEKEDWYARTTNAPMLDLQVFSVPFNNPTAQPKDVAYAVFGDGGNRDATYRPGHANQIIYTHYTYDAATRTQQQIQLFMEDPGAISAHPGVYHPGMPGTGYDPGIAITPSTADVIEPAFSPDGNSIAYVKRNATDMSLYVMPTPPDSITVTPNDPNTEKQALEMYTNDSSGLVTHQLYIEQPVWSPDGTQIAYITYANSSFDLWIANVTHNAQTNKWTVKGSPTQVTSGGVDGDSRPVWTAS
jgi:Tol biopolymer transport system component